MKKANVQSLMALCIAAAMSGCGGGGGGGGDNTSNNTTPHGTTYSGTTATVTVDGTTGPAVAADAVGAVQAVPAALPSIASFVAAPNSQIVSSAALTTSRAESIAEAAAVGSSGGACPGGGTMTDVRTGSGVGSTRTLSFDNCVLPGILRQNGSLAITTTAQTGTPGTYVADWSRTLTVTFDRFDTDWLADPGSYSVIQGSATRTETFVLSTTLLTTHQIGASLYYNDVYLGQRMELWVKNFDNTWTNDRTTGYQTADVNATIVHAGLSGPDGSFDIDTTVPFSFPPIIGGAQVYPAESGQMVVTGKNNAKARIVAGNYTGQGTTSPDSTLTIDFDLDGTGWGGTITRQWSAL